MQGEAKFEDRNNGGRGEKTRTLNINLFILCI